MLPIQHSPIFYSMTKVIEAGEGINNNWTEKPVDVLAWPSRLDQHRGRSGWLLGWRTNPSNTCGLEAWIVAGVLESHQEKIPLAREYDNIDSVVKKKSKTCCFCCSCESSTGDVGPVLSNCSGCTRQICFENLCIIAFASCKESFVTAHAKNIPVPIIHLDETGRPLPQKDVRWRQLLIYDDLCKGITNDKNNFSFCLFQSKTSTPKSCFSREILTRLTHASSVLTIIREAREKPQPSYIASPVKQKQISSDRDTVTDGANTLCGEGGPPFHPGSFLFLRQLQTSSCSPLLTFAKSFKSQRQLTKSTSLSCSKCGKLQAIDKSNYEKANGFTTTFNTMVVSIVDVALGVLLGLLAMYFVRSDSLSLTVDDKFIKHHYNLLVRSMDWLERFPIGFKLNVRLTQSMGKGIRSLIAWHEGMLYGLASQYVTKSIKQSAGFAIFGVGLVFGASGLVALLSDVIQLAFVHISFLDFCFRQVYSNELYLLRALWRLFRGKKRNILRQRTDTMEYDSTQLLLGTILFTVALFMLTTVVVYHSFFAVLNLLVLTLTVMLTSIYLFVRRFPWGKLWLRAKRPQWYIEDVYLEDMCLFSEGSDSTHLRVVVTAPSTIISGEMMASMKELISWIGKFLVNSISGQGG